MSNINEYTSRWKMLADKAGVPHEANLTHEESTFQIVGHFQGDWESEVNYLVEKYNGGFGFNFLTKLSRFSDTRPYTYDLDKEDMRLMGLSETTEFVSKIVPSELRDNYNECPILWKMINWFGFTGKIIPKIHIQLPGQSFPFHFDDLTTTKENEDNYDVDNNHTRYARIEIQLLDWNYGQVWAVGNSYWKNWKAGEIMFHDWKTIPHGTSNIGLTSRICLQITGEVSDELYDKLRKYNGVVSV